MISLKLYENDLPTSEFKKDLKLKGIYKNIFDEI